MIVGIDASSIRGGGGLTHLVELLRVAKPMEQGVSQVIIWSGRATLGQIEDRPWLVKSQQPMLDKSLLHRSFWQRFVLHKLAQQVNCDALFVPGSSYAGSFRPVVVLSQNLLPFEWRELRRYGWSLMGLRLMLLRWIQSRTFRQAEGLIFLTRYARDVVMQTIKVNTAACKTEIIPHGIEAQFLCPPREQLSVSGYSSDRPFRILYVSIVDLYKHQWHVAEAVAQLREGGLHIELELVGPAYPPALPRLRKALDRVDPDGEFVRYVGAVPHDELHAFYASADLCLFASSCENLPNILLEGMASGLPIACSNRGPMPEVLGDAGVYFDPENPQDIARAIRELIDSPTLRAKLAKASFGRVREYSWQSCASETFAFIGKVSCADGTISASV